MKLINECTQQLVELTPDLLSQNSNNGYLYISKESIHTYIYLRDDYIKTKKDLSTNYLFRSVFSSFYGMGFLKDVHKDQFFRGVQDCVEVNLESLYNSISNNGLSTFQFSFITKILNLNNPEVNPIYDSHVAKCLDLDQIDNTKKLESAKEIYNNLIDYYKELKGQSAIKYCLKQFNETFCDEKIERLPDIKKIDFLIWATGKYISKGKKASWK